MTIHGTEIQTALKRALAERARALPHAPTLCVIQIGNDPTTNRFIRMKEKFGEAIGARVSVTQLPEESTLPEVLFAVAEKNNDPACTGIIVQLPLPEHIDPEAVCNAIDPQKDVDALGVNSTHTAPVALAVQEILSRASVSIADKTVVVVGEGKLVGTPVANFFRKEGIAPHIVTAETKNPEQYLKQADIIVSGAGDPHFITPEGIKEGAVLIDAGTSEQGGKLQGDIHPDCADKASVFTPVPGGVGPITVATLFANLLETAGK